MLKENLLKDNLWDLFCTTYVGDKILNIWLDTVENFQLNFIDSSLPEQEIFIEHMPSWESVITLMGSQGLSSADAMIINFFQSSKFELILSNDVDIEYAVHKLNNPKKLCLVPDSIFKTMPT